MHGFSWAREPTQGNTSSNITLHLRHNKQRCRSLPWRYPFSPDKSLSHAGHTSWKINTPPNILHNTNNYPGPSSEHTFCNCTQDTYGHEVKNPCTEREHLRRSPVSGTWEPQIHSPLRRRACTEWLPSDETQYPRRSKISNKPPWTVSTLHCEVQRST